MIKRRHVLCLGLSQLVCWGISFYLIGVFGELMVADLGWPPTLVYGGFSAALLTMGLTSPWVGRAIDRHGGGRVMAAGSVLTAAGCVGLAVAETLPLYYLVWVCLGVAMRATLYDAAFATLARLGGSGAQQPIAQITLLGGLASTAFWPIGHGLAEVFGWRGALLAYAGFAVLTLPLHLAIPAHRHQDSAAPSPAAAEARPPATTGRTRLVAAALYALIITLINGLNAGLSAHMIAALTELGLAATLAVTVASLRGVGQSAARLVAILFAGWMRPTDLNLLAAAILPVCFTVGLASGGHLAAAVFFAFFYGAGNGLLSITRGTVPLVLFDLHDYGAYVGKLLAPSFVVAAAAPMAFAAVIERFGAVSAFVVAIALAAVVVAAALGLKLLADRPPAFDDSAPPPDPGGR